MNPDTFEDNQRRAAGYLDRFRTKPTGHYIGGVWTDATTAETFENLDPATNTPMGTVVACTG